MKRDFTVENENSLVEMVQKNENEKWSDFTDKIGDTLIGFGEQIGLLGLYKNIAGAKKYTKLILDKNNTSINEIHRIFDGVRRTDNTWSINKIKVLCDVILSITDNEKDVLSVITHHHSKFNYTELAKIKTSMKDICASVENIKRNKDYSMDVYEIIYDSNGKRESLYVIMDVDKRKVVDAFEDLHPDYQAKINELLASGSVNTLTETDILNIKFLAYTTEEPFRSIYLNHIDKYEIGTTMVIDDEGNIGGSYYQYSTNTINFGEDPFWTDPRGPYTTFFHESGHATDYQYADGNLSLPMTMSYEAQKLQQAIENDVYNDIRNTIMTEIEKESAGIEGIAENIDVDKILNTYRYGQTNVQLNADEARIKKMVDMYYKSDLAGAVNEAASDVYGGVTNLAIDAGFGHRPNKKKGQTIDTYTYWYKNGKPTYAQSKELWAEYFSYKMTGNEAALESLRRHFPTAITVLDEIAQKMGCQYEK